MAPPKKRANEPEPRPIIVKKIIAEAHGGHHGGAWKVAYADFVTAMMAFFLLMWLLGATTEKQRKSLADYFTPTLITTKENSAGSNGLFGGDSMMGKDNYPTTGGQGNLAITIPRDATGTKDVGGKSNKNRAEQRQQFEALKRAIVQRLSSVRSMQRLLKSLRFTETREGLRIDVIDQADFAMFAIGTDILLPEARELIGQVAQTVEGVPNDVIVRGHTDALRYSAGRGMNNWRLSADRAEATRVELARSGVRNDRFLRIEGVADREPFVPDDPLDARNRRMSIILAWSDSSGGSNGGTKAAPGHATSESDVSGGEEATAESDAEIQAAIRKRDDPRAIIAENARRSILGTTALPDGAVIVNSNAIPKRKPTPQPH